MPLRGLSHALHLLGRDAPAVALVATRADLAGAVPAPQRVDAHADRRRRLTEGEVPLTLPRHCPCRLPERGPPRRRAGKVLGRRCPGCPHATRSPRLSLAPARWGPTLGRALSGAWCGTVRAIWSRSRNRSRSVSTEIPSP